VRIVFAGTPAFSVPGLNALIVAESVDVAGVYTQPDRPAGRGKKQRQSPVKQLALTYGIAVFQPESLRDESVVVQLRQLKPDLMVVVAYGLILPISVLSIPSLGCINIHASLLPRWRGAAPIQRAIEAGDDRTGICLMQMDQGLDTGPVLARSSIPITADDTAHSVHDKLAILGGELLGLNLSAIAAQVLPAVAQDETQACYAPKLEKAEAKLDWQLSAMVLERKVRAFNPWPMAFAQLNHTSLRVLRASVDHTPTEAQPGYIIEADSNGIVVATAEGKLILTEVQKPGGRPMPVAALLNGMEIKPGMRFGAETI